MLVDRAPVVVGVPLNGPWEVIFVAEATGGISDGIVVNVVVGSETKGMAQACPIRAIKHAWEIIFTKLQSRSR